MRTRAGRRVTASASSDKETLVTALDRVAPIDVGVFEALASPGASVEGTIVPRLGAALAFYTLFSLAPILVLVIAIAGFFYGAEAAQGQLLDELRGLVGKQGAEAITLVLDPERGVGQHHR